MSVYLIIKRIIDICFVFFISPLFFVTYIIVGILIKLEDGGPIIYKSKRLGKEFKIFDLYKFRSMKLNSPSVRTQDGILYVTEKDPRLTKIGKIIRKYSIDELPQIINIMKGDITLVGPRPSPLGNIELYPDCYKEKFKVLPGITGLVQALYRNEAPANVRQQLDIYYIKNMGLRLDIMILIKTAFMIATAKGVFHKNE